MQSRRRFGRNVLLAASALGMRNIALRGVLASGCTSGDAGTTEVGPAYGARDASMPAARDSGVVDASVAAEPAISKPAGKPRRVVVVGTGYGGAVTALRLVERGIPVTMIEMGRLWNEPGPDGEVFCKPFSPDGRAMFFKDRTDAVIKQLGPFSTAFDVPKQAGVIDIVGNDDMQAYVGRGVGGGSLVNLAIYVLPEREAFRTAFPQVDLEEMYAKYYPLAQATLQAARVPGEIAYNAECYQYSRVGRAAAEGAGYDVELCTSGYDYDYMAQEIAGTVKKSALGGEALYGNNYGKRSLDKTYLAEAMGSGLLTIRTLTQVHEIQRAPSGEYVLSCRTVDLDGKVLSETEETCTELFLSGGSFGTSELLVRARETGALPDLNEHVGTAWGPNGDLFVGRTNPLWQPTGAVQGSVPSMAFHAPDQDGKSVFSMIVPFPAGFETFFSMNIVMPQNPEAGSFVYDAASDAVRLKWDVSQNGPALKSTRFLFDKINRAAGTDYNSDVFGDGKDVADTSTYHPVGGCPLGRATDAYGRIPRYKGLYVMDGSLIPVGIAANPSLTITALAERNIARILVEDFS